MSGRIWEHTVCDPGWVSNSIPKFWYCDNQLIVDDWTQIQGGWVFDRPSCGKPRVDLALDLMCYTAGRRLNNTDDERHPSDAGSLGLDFGDRGDEAFRGCCDPPEDLPPGFTKGNVLYQKEKNCGGMNFCFTTNVWTAHNWTDCVHKAANKLMDEFRAEGSLQFNYTAEEALEAECEVVYYDWLRYPMKVKEPDRKKCVTSGVVQTRIAMVPLLLSAMLAVALTL
ncbi:hypothetical protein PG995_007605 [Apiospora arundinis]